MAAFEKLKAEEENFVDRVTEAAGFSIGEYCALVIGDVISFEDGNFKIYWLNSKLINFLALKIIKVRAQAIHDCSLLVPSGMMTIRVTASSRLDNAIFDAKEAARLIFFIKKLNFKLCLKFYWLVNL